MNGSDKEGMGADRTCPRAAHAQFARKVSSFRIQVIQDFQMIREEADRHHADLRRAGPAQLPETVADIGFEPGLRRWPTAALEDQFPIEAPDILADQSGCFLKLLDIQTGLGHGHGDAVCRKEDLYRRALGPPKLRQGGAYACGDRTDESWMVKERPDLLDLGRVRTYYSPRPARYSRGIGGSLNRN